jgi:membrane-anchored protein YejM (alkaline phosphatase superfamily)
LTRPRGVSRFSSRICRSPVTIRTKHHADRSAAQDEIDRYRDALYDGDVALGALIDGIRRRGLERNTVWILYGDHGEAFGQHIANFGHTFYVYDENVHVPFVIAAPGRLEGSDARRPDREPDGPLRRRFSTSPGSRPPWSIRAGRCFDRM